MKTIKKSNTSDRWLKELAVAIPVGLIIGYLVGFSLYDPFLGFKYGCIVSLLTFIVHRWKNNWTVLTIILLVLLTIIFLSFYSNTTGQSSGMLRNIPTELHQREQMWRIGAEFHRLSYLVLALIGTISWILIFTDVARLRPYHRWLALASALAFGIISAFDLGTKANQFRDGYRILNTATMRYEVDSTFTIDQLINAYQEGERTIGSVKPNPF
ncbi:MAG: hypothetical protein JXA06_06170 [Bacteroidetes bacterium]|nr:hypothetical protein [Bacteroidota bacterium]